MTVQERMINTPEGWSARAGLVDPWEVAGWSQTGQALRFQAVLRHLDLRADDTLLDFGCATGAFYSWLRDCAVPVRYFGYDWAPSMLERAKSEHPHASFLDQWKYAYEFDHIIAIGCFNLRDNWSKPQTIQTLRQLWAVTRRTLVVSLYRGYDTQCIHYAPADLAEFVELEQVNKFVIDGTHLDNDVILRLSR